MKQHNNYSCNDENVCDCCKQFDCVNNPQHYKSDLQETTIKKGSIKE